MSELKVNKLTGITGTSAGAPITLSGDTTTLGTGVTLGSGVTLDSGITGIPAAGITGALGSGVTIPAASGAAMVLISSTTLTSAQALVEFTLSSSYSKFILFCEGVSVATDTGDLSFRVSTDNGSTYPTNIWDAVIQYLLGGSAGGSSYQERDAYGFIGESQEKDVGTGAVSAEVHIWNTNSTTDYKAYSGHGITRNEDGTWYRYHSEGFITTLAALTKLKVYDNEGSNLDAGKITLYGIKDS